MTPIDRAKATTRFSIAGGLLDRLQRVLHPPKYHDPEQPLTANFYRARPDQVRQLFDAWLREQLQLLPASQATPILSEDNWTLPTGIRSAFALCALNGWENLAAGTDEYAISLAYLEDNRIFFGLMLLGNGQLMSASTLSDAQRPAQLGIHYRQNGTALMMGGVGTRTSVDGSPFAAGQLAAYLHHSPDFHLRVIGSVGYSLSRVVRNQWQFYVHPCPRLTDVAAALFLLKAAGRPTMLGDRQIIGGSAGDDLVIDLSRLTAPDYRLPRLVTAANQAALDKIYEVVQRELPAANSPA